MRNIVKADGTGKQQLTTDANDSIMYQQVRSFLVSYHGIGNMVQIWR